MSEPEPVWTVKRRLPPAPLYPYYVPDRLWRQSELTAKRVTLLPRHLKGNRSSEFKPYDLANPRARARAYSMLLVHGTSQQLMEYLDANLLCEVWDDMLVPWNDVRPSWQPLIDTYRAENK